MKIAIEYIEWLQSEIAKINSYGLDQIEFYEKGMLVEIPEEIIKEFKFVGLNNIAFITSGFYRKNWIQQ